MASVLHHTGPAERDPQRTDPTVRQLIGFRLDEEDFAGAIRTTQEITLMKPITRLPQVPEAIEGLINLRGAVNPIVGLRKRFGLLPRPFDDETRTVVVNTYGKAVGLVVDEVTQVMRVTGDQIQPVPPSMAASARRYVLGRAKLKDRLVIILDIDTLFDPNKPDPGAGPPGGAPRSTPMPGPGGRRGSSGGARPRARGARPGRGGAGGPGHATGPRRVTNAVSTARRSRV